jgi:Auxiliary Activity family 9 (formerly GH61)
MKTFIAICLPLLATFLPSVEAHGYIADLTIDGSTSYAGNAPSVPTQPSPIRQISTVNPVKNATNPNLTCGQHAQPASMVVDVNAGSNITLTWGVLTGPGTHWPHGTGALFFIYTIIGGLVYHCYLPRTSDGLHGFLWFHDLRQVRCLQCQMVQDSTNRP